MLKEKDPQLQLFIGDIALVTVGESNAFCIRINDISYDVKPGWLKVFFTALTMPLENHMWTLSTEQLNGEPFSMKGTPIKIQRLIFPEPKVEEEVKKKEVSKVVDITERIKLRDAGKPKSAVPSVSDSYPTQEV